MDRRQLILRQALFLPEASDYIASSPAESISLARSVTESEFVLGLQREAQQAQLHINVGIHEPAADGKVKNTLVWINEKGLITQRYQKIHLFDVDIKNGPVLKESAYVGSSHHRSSYSGFADRFIKERGEGHGNTASL